MKNRTRVTATLYATAVSALMATLFACGDGGGPDLDIGDEGSQSLPVIEGRVIAPECGGAFAIEGTQVVLRNELGDIIGTGTSGSNLLALLHQPCVVEFVIAEVPAAKFYSLEVGTSKGPALSANELENLRFQPVLALGDAEILVKDDSEFCASMDDLMATVEDLKLLNDDFELWSSLVAGHGSDIRAWATGRLLDSNPNMSLADESLTAASALQSFNGYYSGIRKLNSDLRSFNTSIRGPYTDAGCGIWSLPEFSAN